MTILFAMVVFAAVAYVVYRSRKRKKAEDAPRPDVPPEPMPRGEPGERFDP